MGKIKDRGEELRRQLSYDIEALEKMEDGERRQLEVMDLERVKRLRRILGTGGRLRKNSWLEQVKHEEGRHEEK